MGTVDLEKKDQGEIDLESDDDDINDGYKNMSMSFIQAKAAAIRTVGEFCESCSMSFKGYFERAMDLVEDNSSHAHETIRHQAMLLLLNLTTAKMKVAFGGNIPKPVEGVKGYGNALQIDADMAEALQNF